MKATGTGWKSFVFAVTGLTCGWSVTGASDLRQEFANPSLEHATRPLWFWNNTTVTAEGVAGQMQMAHDQCGYGGFGILPFGGAFKPTYLSEDYFQVYGAALKKARELGMKMCVYDEYGFPSGSAGAIHGDGVPRFANKHPEHTIKRLDKHEQDVKGPGKFAATIPEGRLMSIVAMEMETKARVDLTGTVQDGRVGWQVPEGTWKVMTFVCVRDGDPNVDYLDPEGVAHFVEMTHQQYYNRFKEYFGNTIDGTFNDEPTMYRAQGRMWTGAFNGKFQAKHGFDPAPWYPALWYDIGPETQAARNYLFGFRTELYATGFPKVIQDWCTKHGIAATGHQDQEEVVNPVSVSGDLMKCFQHQDIPGVDKIGGDRPAERFYKVISSAANNWDKALVMSETYGAMGDIGWDTVYHVAMEQYTKGINQLIPHAVWYDDSKVTFKPELSWRHPKYADGLPEYNKFMSRLNLMLQNHGRHVADIAVLYPIATLQGGHHLDGALGYYKGGVAIPEADYVDLGELLACEVGRDYTFLHPEVLDEKCEVIGNTLRLNNTVNHEQYRVMIVPGHKTIHWSSLKKIKAFHDQGGMVIATGTLPSKSAEFGHDEDVVHAIEALFPGARAAAKGRDRVTASGHGPEAGEPGPAVATRNAQGGMAVFLERPTAGTLRDTLDQMLDVYDVEFEAGKALRYIHKIKDGRHIYFLANLGDTAVSTRVDLRGKLRPELWNPHTGGISAPGYTHRKNGAVHVTSVGITLAPTTSVFVIGRDEDRLEAAFRNPPAHAGTVTLWWLNGELSKAEIRTQMLAMRDQCGFSGVAPLTMYRMKPPTTPHYLSEEYFEMYGCILDTAKELGMSVVFYDDCDFPSGTAGNQMAEQHPDDLMKYLARSTAAITGPGQVGIRSPEGVLMSVVARNIDTGERRVVTSEATLESAGTIDGKLAATHTVPGENAAVVRWTAPAGRWDVQAFVCATAPARRFVDCLDPQAMAKFIGLTYDRFARRFPEHFGSTVRMTFYDDLSTYHVPDCLMWSPAFNEAFQARFGRSPEALYPALWEDIGPETAAARASLYGLRNEQFAAGYPRAVQEWCDRRGMTCSGHPAASYRANPLQSPGDAMLFYKYQGAPLTDYIHYFDHGIDGFKVPASAAYNYDRPTVVCEIYGNFHQKLPNDSHMLYRAGMEVYARGINFLLPHGTWWDPAKMRIVPEISWRNPAYASELPRFNRWAARCEGLLRAGRHTADIGVLYPIDDLAARYHVGLLPFTHGKDAIPGSDYYELSRLLTGEIRRDFTFLHPEIVDGRCRVEGREFVLDNPNNRECYRVLILPACRTIRVGNLRKARDFLAAGGCVIATTCLPDQSADFGHDEEVRGMVQEMFGPGGKGVFVPAPDEATLQQALDGIGFAWDVRITDATDIPRKYRQGNNAEAHDGPDAYEGGNRAFAYLHRSVTGAEVYFFANASDLTVSAKVEVRGRLHLEMWDPHTGSIKPLASTPAEHNGEPITRFDLSMAPIRSMFVVGRKEL